MITNPRIEKKKSDIARTEVKFAEIKARLREQRQELIALENEEIVAMFRKEVITEDDLKSLMRSRQENESDCEENSPDERTHTVKNPTNKGAAIAEFSPTGENFEQKRKGESTDELSEN